MSQNSISYWVYILLLGFFFGCLYLMEFMFPQYIPETYGIPAEQEDNVTEVKPTYESDPKVVMDSTTNADKVFSESHDQSAVDFFDSLKKKYQTSMLNQLKPGKPRTDVIIRYYKHPPDGDKVYALRDLGFYIHERPVDKGMTQYESNSIFYGDSIRNEDLLIVAYTLIQQGLPIKNIEPSLYHDGWKYNAIEIGADSTVLEKGVLTLDELLNFRSDL